MGRADLEFGNAVDLLDECGEPDSASTLQKEIVGRNVLDGRWSFQIVEEFDDLYYGPAVRSVRDLERVHLDGRFHLFESRMNEHRRTNGAPGHESRPPTTRFPVVDLDPRS